MEENNNSNNNERMLDLKPLFDHIKLKYINMIDTLFKKNSPKDIISLDKIKPLYELILDIPALKERNVQLAFLSPVLYKNYNTADLEDIVLFIENKSNFVIQAIEFINKVLLNKSKKNIHLILYPRITNVAKLLLKEANLEHMFNLNLHEFDFDLIPLDSDLLSLEYESDFEEICLTNEYEVHRAVAKSIQRLQYVFGYTNLKFYKGDNAFKVKKILEYLEEINKSDVGYLNSNGEFDAICIIDRKCDLLTPFLTQFTYQGILDEAYKININSINIKNNILENVKDEDIKDINFQLIDPIFDQVKNDTLATLGGFLKNRLIEFQKITQDKEKLKDLKEMQKVSKEIKTKKFVENHINLIHNIGRSLNKIINQNALQNEQECLYGMGSKNLTEFIKDLISIESDKYRIYRLLIIGSICDNGFVNKNYDLLKTEISKVYGIDSLKDIAILEECGLIYNKDIGKAKVNYAYLKKNFKLINEDFNPNNNDLSMFYNGFTPILIKIIESILLNGSKSDIIEKTDGKFLIENSNFLPDFLNKKHPKKVLIYIIGGLTYSELSCIRFIGKVLNREITVATTSMINKNNLLKKMLN